MGLTRHSLGHYGTALTTPTFLLPHCGAPYSCTASQKDKNNKKSKSRERQIRQHMLTGALGRFVSNTKGGKKIVFFSFFFFEDMALIWKWRWKWFFFLLVIMCLYDPRQQRVYGCTIKARLMTKAHYLRTIRTQLHTSFTVLYLIFISKHFPHNHYGSHAA